MVGVLLAAGASSRFGADKLLHPLDDGTTIAARSARALAAALPGSVAVVRDVRSGLSQVLRAAGLRPVGCAAASAGMGASLACGVAAEPDASGWVVCLADMPFVRMETIAAVAAALGTGAAIAAPVHGGRRGHPVGFGRRYRDDLMALAEDQGAREIVTANRDRLVLVETDDEGVLRDVDAPGDLAASR